MSEKGQEKGQEQEEAPNFNQICSDLKKAMEGFGTDEEKLITIVTDLSLRERLKTKEAYKVNYGKDLIEDLKGELSGKFEDLIIGLFTDPIEYDAENLYKSMKGAGTDEETLIEIIASRPPWLLKKIKEKFSENYKETLEDFVKGDTSGDFQKILLGILECKRSANKEEAEEECKKLAEEMWGDEGKKWKIEDGWFNKFFIESSPEEMAAISREFFRVSKKNVMNQIEESFSGDIKTLLKDVVYATISPSEYFAVKVNEAIQGFGTNNKKLIRILVSRNEVDMHLIIKYYKRLYKKDMIEEIKNEVSGDYQKLILALLQKKNK